MYVTDFSYFLSLIHIFLSSSFIGKVVSGNISSILFFALLVYLCDITSNMIFSLKSSGNFSFILCIKCLYSSFQFSYKNTGAIINPIWYPALATLTAASILLLADAVWCSYSSITLCAVSYTHLDVYKRQQ